MNPGKEMTLQELKDWHIDLINERRQEAVFGGFSFMGIMFDSDSQSTENIMGVTTIAMGLKGQGGDFPPGFTWRAMNNVDVPMNVDKMIGLGFTAFQHRAGCYQYSWYLKGLVEAKTEEQYQELLDMDVMENWPTV